MRRPGITGVVCGVLMIVTGLSLDAADDPRRPVAIATTGVPVVSTKSLERLRRYQNVRSASFRGWAADRRGMLVQTRFGNTAQLHRVGRPGGRREQLTFFEEPADGRFLRMVSAMALAAARKRISRSGGPAFRARSSTQSGRPSLLDIVSPPEALRWPPIGLRPLERSCGGWNDRSRCSIQTSSPQSTQLVYSAMPDWLHRLAVARLR